jgi:hypothetical protein
MIPDSSRGLRADPSAVPPADAKNHRYLLEKQNSVNGKGASFMLALFLLE